MEQVRSESTASQRFTLLLIGLLAVMAAALAALGVYSVGAYDVAQRSRELGIRVALGAQRGALMRLMLLRSVALTFTGVILGITGALAMTGSMSALLFDVGPHDPIAFAGAAALLLTISLVASFLPARRAMKTDPVVALKN
jgi:putative ABC transport system permease protein